MTRYASIRVVAVAVLLSAAAGCSGGTEPRFDRTRAMLQLERRRDQWRAVGPSAYQYRVQRSCWCAPEYTTPARVEVRDGRVTDARAVATGEPLPLQLFDTIDDLFTFAIAEAERGALKEIAFDARFGHPTTIRSGTPNPDDGQSTEVSELAAIP